MTTRGPSRAFTLLEILLALALLLAMAAMVVPVMTRTLDERRFEAAVDQVTGQLLMARAHAERTGRPVDVLYIGERREVRARWFDPEAGAGDPADLRITMSWARRPLPGDLRITDEDPAADVREPGAYDFLAAGPSDVLAEDPVLRLAVYLPDGSALMTTPVWILDDAGRLGAVSINAFTGVPRVDDAPAPPFDAPDPPPESLDEPADADP